MLFDTFATQAGQASMDALWLRSQMLLDNIANVDTPGYKAKDVTFSQTLAQATRNQKYGLPTGSAQYRAKVVTNNATSNRVDGNNVDYERDSTELWKTYAQYSYLVDRVSGYYKSVNTAISNMRT